MPGEAGVSPGWCRRPRLLRPRRALLLFGDAREEQPRNPSQAVFPAANARLILVPESSVCLRQAARSPRGLRSVAGTPVSEG